MSAKDKFVAAFTEKLTTLANEWKTKQSKSAYECGEDLLTCLHRFYGAWGEVSAYEQEQDAKIEVGSIHPDILRNLLTSLSNECFAPGSPKAVAYAAAKEALALRPEPPVSLATPEPPSPALASDDLPPSAPTVSTEEAVEQTVEPEIQASTIDDLDPATVLGYVPHEEPIDVAWNPTYRTLNYSESGDDTLITIPISTPSINPQDRTEHLSDRYTRTDGRDRY